MARRPTMPSFLDLLLAFQLFLFPVLAYKELSDESLKRIPSGGLDFDIHNGALLAPILIPRVPGTAGSAKAQDHFVSFFKQHLPKWKIEWHNSTSKTPATGNRDIPFANLIFQRDPPWAAHGDVARLTLVAHYDSLYKPEGFIGAIDSAAPCAMLMHVARSIDEALTKKWDAMKASGEGGDGLEEEKGVQILFLDGEEAWVSWSATDSLYGSRALAATWESTNHPAMSVFPNPLNSISLFVLLDLLGSSDPIIPSYFQSTHWAYQNMATIEQRMRDLKLLESKPRGHFLPEKTKQASAFTTPFMQDDHIPFMARGVNVLHLIPSHFPDVWHTMQDDGEHLDGPTVQDWAKIVTAFAAEWMELDGLLPPTKGHAKRDNKTEL